MRVLLLTSSARGHAIAEALHRSRHHPEIISLCTTRNPGILPLATEQHVMDLMDFKAVAEIAKRTKPDFAIIGPDDPIGNGLADVLEGQGTPTIAPKKSLAQIESSKSFARDIMDKYGIDASPKFRIFTRANNSHGALEKEKKELYNYIDQELNGEYVVKFDGLRGGKGVKVGGEHLSNIDEGVAYAIACLDECGRVVLEEKLTGVEFSLLSFVSGEQTVDMPAVQDHKRAYEGDTGPNTGGMGTYSDANHSLPFLKKEDLERASEINRLTAQALQQECGEPYKGILYGGFMAVKDGIKVIEFNARFGDPEALNILSILESDFVDVCLNIHQGNLSSNSVSFARKATVCKYIVPKSYPEAKMERDQSVSFPSSIPENARIYYGDISRADDGSLRLGGSRTAGIVGIGSTLAEAEKVAEDLCKKVEGPVRYRSDIGTAKLIQERIATMMEIRS